MRTLTHANAYSCERLLTLTMFSVTSYVEPQPNRHQLDTLDFLLGSNLFEA